MNNRIVNIIVLNWNGTQDTIACLQSINDLEYKNYNLILVDNGSDNGFDELYSWCKDTYNHVIDVFYKSEFLSKISSNLGDDSITSSITVIKNEDNLGFAAGNNVALRYIQSKKDKAEYCLLLNNDTIVEADFISHLVGFMTDNPEYVACTPQIRLYEPNNRIWNCGGDLLWFGNRKYHYANADIVNVPQSGSRDITYITGCALFFKPEKTGLLSEKFFFGEEDFEFSLRQKKTGNKMACVYNSIIYHKVGATIKQTNENMLGRVYLFYLQRLIDNRDYSTKFLFNIQKVLLLSYAVILIKKQYRISFTRIFMMMKRLLKDVKQTEVVDKEKTYECFSLKF